MFKPCHSAIQAKGQRRKEDKGETLTKIPVDGMSSIEFADSFQYIDSKKLPLSENPLLVKQPISAQRQTDCKEGSNNRIENDWFTTMRVCAKQLGAHENPQNSICWSENTPQGSKNKSES